MSSSYCEYQKRWGFQYIFSCSCGASSTGVDLHREMAAFSHVCLLM